MAAINSHNSQFREIKKSEKKEVHFEIKYIFPAMFFCHPHKLFLSRSKVFFYFVTLINFSRNMSNVFLFGLSKNMFNVFFILNVFFFHFPSLDFF